MVSIDTEVLEMAIGVYFQDELEPRLKNKIYIPKVYSQLTSRKVGEISEYTSLRSTLVHF